MKKYLICFCILMISCIFNFPVFAASEELPQFVRVGMKTVSSNYSVEMIASEGVALYKYEGGDLTLIESYPEVNKAKIQIEYGVVNLINASNSEVLSTFSVGDTYCVGPVGIRQDIWTLNAEKYRGAMMFLKDSDQVRMVNVLDAEQYLYGVLPKEMSGTYPLEALKAQAVAARCYALLNISSHNSSGYDVCTSTHCQVYGGVAGEAARCTQAVDETKGVLVYYEGKPVACYYSANNGGYIESSYDIWGSQLGYLTGKKDEYNPEYTWTAQFTASDLKRLLDQSGNGVGDIKTIAILQTSAGGSVLEMQFVGTSGEVTLKKEKIRTVLGSNDVKSLNFTFSSLNESSESGFFYMIDQWLSASKKAVNDIYVMGRDGVKTKYDAAYVYVKEEGKAAVSQSISSYQIVDGFNGISINGIGYGHSIGMSQQGAKVMADKGLNYIEILKHYFTGIEVH